MNEPVHVRYNAGQAVVRVGHAELTVEPRDSQQRSALCPVELVSAALGTWIVLTVSAVAEHKGITVEHIAVSIQRKTVELEAWETSFSVRLDLGTGLTPRERTILFNASRRCDVHKLLTGAMRFDYGWLDQPLVS